MLLNLFIFFFVLFFVLNVFCAENNVNNFDKMTKVFQWRQIGYKIDSIQYTKDTNRELKLGYIFFDEELEDQEVFLKQYNNIPIGLAVHECRVFVTVPRRRYGIPSTLNYVDLKQSPLGSSPLLRPYPNSDARSGLVSVYRPRVDSCGRLWVLDTGLLEVPNAFVQQKPPEIVVYDLKTDTEIRRHRLSDDVIVNGTTSGFTSITVDVTPFTCDDAFAYINDLARGGVVVYSWRQQTSWRFTHRSFTHDVEAMNFTVGGFTINWRDGIFSLALSDADESGRRKVYYHPFISTQEFVISNEVLKNKYGDFDKNFKLEGSRGALSQSGSHDYHGPSKTLFYANVAQDAILCWNTRSTLTEQTVGIVAQDQELRYISDLKVVGDEVWVLSNRIPQFIYSQLDTNHYNFFVHKAKVQDLIAGSVCDSKN